MSAQRRLLEDLEGMKSLKAQSKGMMDFDVSKNLRNYTVRLKGIEGFKGTSEGSMTKASEFVFTITLHSDHPNAKPVIVFNETIYHPNCYRGGRMCTDWNISMKIKDLVIDIARTINYEIANPGSPANSDASNWYIKNKQRIRELIKKADFPPASEDMMTFYQRTKEELVFL